MQECSSQKTLLLLLCLRQYFIKCTLQARNLYFNYNSANLDMVILARTSSVIRNLSGIIFSTRLFLHWLLSTVRTDGGARKTWLMGESLGGYNNPKCFLVYHASLLRKVGRPYVARFLCSEHFEFFSQMVSVFIFDKTEVRQHPYQINM